MRRRRSQEGRKSRNVSSQALCWNKQCPSTKDFLLFVSNAQVSPVPVPAPFGAHSSGSSWALLLLLLDLFVCVCWCAPPPMLLEDRQGSDSLELELQVAMTLLLACWGPHSGLLPIPQMSFSTEPSLQSLFFFFFGGKFSKCI